MVDLSLVPFEDMLAELDKRNQAYILATLRIETGNEPIVSTFFTKSKFIDCLGICSALEEDIKQYYMVKPDV